MSQENSTSENTKENKKKIFLGVLLLALVGVVYFQFFSGSDKPVSASKPGPANPGSTGNTGNKNVTAPALAQGQTPQRSGTPEPIISQPLDLASMQVKNNTGSGTGRNIFVYPTPTPLPPAPPTTPTPTPVPPPITIFSINPGCVIARTGDFTLTVYGKK